MNTNEISFARNLVKGKIAETIFAHLKGKFIYKKSE